MSDFLKMITPIMITLLLSGLGTATYALYTQVQAIESKQIDSIKYVVLIDQLRKESNDYEQRLRKVEKRRE